MTREQWKKVLTILVEALLAIAAVVGWILPTQQMQFGTQAVRERIGIDARDDSYVYNGADVRWYSDDHSTEVHRVDGAGGAKFTAPTAQATATPGVVVDCAHVGNCIEIRDASTPVWYVSNGGGVTQNGSTTYSDNATFNDAIVVQATPASTATPQVMISDVGAGVPFEIRNASATPVAAVEGDYDWNLYNNSISNIGAAGTDFSETGGLALADDLDMSAQPIVNIGNAGTDFDTNGGLTTASTLTVTAGGLVVTAGGATITAGGLDMTDDAIVNIGASGTDFSATGGLTLADDLDMSNQPILNVGNAGTDFGTDGSLTTASTITVTAGGLVVTAGGATITAGGLDMTDDAITNIGNSGTDFGADGSLTTASTITVTAGGLVVTAGGATITAGGLDMTDDPITNIGNAGTDFDTNGGLTTASTITVTAGGMVVSAGLTDIGEGTYTLADSDNDLGVAGDLEVNGTIEADGVISQVLNLENIGMLPSIATCSITYTAAAGGSGNCWTVGDGEIWYVHAVFAHVTENWDCTGDDCLVEIGDSGDADGLLDLDDAELQTSDTEGTGAPASWQGFMSTDTRGAYLANGLGFIYAPSGSATNITWSADEADGETMGAGALTVYIVYTRIQ